MPGDEVPYGEDTSVIITGEGSYVIGGDPGDECIEVLGGCVEFSEAREQYCDHPGAQADIIVLEGEVVQVVCYPSPDQGVPIEEIQQQEDGAIEIPQNENGAVITFDEDTDGQPLQGDLTIDAERTTLYGNGVGSTIIDGKLTMASNNSNVRSLTITGDVLYDSNSNNSAIAYCDIYGNLTVTSNNAIVIETRVYGKVKITGNNALLVNLGVAGDWEVSQTSLCDGCYSFEDSDDDHLITNDEITGDLDCGGK